MIRPEPIVPLLLRAPFKRTASPQQISEIIHTAAPTQQLESNHFRHLDAKHVARYHKVVHWPLAQQVHPCYLHLLAFPQHMKLLLRDEIPFAPIGSVHLHNQMEQIRPINLFDEFKLNTAFIGFRQHDKGTLVELRSWAETGDQRLWQSSSQYLYRHGQGKSTQTNKKHTSSNTYHDDTLGEEWCLPSNLGRQYAKVSGDYNPIHLWPITAKLFGFPRAIAHGMWSKARSLSALSHFCQGAMSCEVEFIKPLFLPNSVHFHHFIFDGSCKFTLSSEHHARCHLAGRLDF